MEDTQIFSKKHLGIKVLVIWASLLTFMAVFNFTNNLEDRERAVKYEENIGEHVEFRERISKLEGAITCIAPVEVKSQNQE